MVMPFCLPHSVMASTQICWMVNGMKATRSLVVFWARRTAGNPSVAAAPTPAAAVFRNWRRWLVIRVSSS